MIVFETPWHALNFCERLHLALPGEVATLRDNVCVIVLDATPYGAHERILMLSRSSSSTSFRTIR